MRRALILAALLCVSVTAAAQEPPAPPPASASPPAAPAAPSSLPGAEPPPLPASPPPAEPSPASAAPALPSSPPRSAAPPPLNYQPTPWETPAGAPAKRRSRGMMIGGIVMSALGGVTAIAGVVYFAAPEPFCDLYGNSGLDRGSCVDTYRGVGVAGMVVGGVLIAIGLPVAIYGAGKVPADAARSAPTPLSLHVGRSDAALRWSF